MLQTLPLVLFIVMAELSIGAFAVLFVLDCRNEVKRSFLITYGLIYIVLTGLTYLFQQGFSTPEQLNTFNQLDKAWTGYEALPLLLFLVLMLPYNVLLWIDKQAGAGDKGEERKRTSTVRWLRLIVGGLTVLAGLATLFVMAMIYRPIADSNMAGVFTVASFFAAALALGGVMTAMWLGHWYLVTPALSEKPLQFATTLVLLGVLAQVIFAVTAGPTTPYAHAHATSATPTVTATAPPNVPGATPTPNPNVKPLNAPVVTPLSTDAIGWLRILVSFVIPLVLGGLAWKLIRDRSFQSATGMLYLVVVCTLAGEAIARGLFLIGLG
ncbi:MAG: DmsC/YnfH family molybdoenzyme membrane anchor subunit [Ktedonobacteraceae bacterium]|jgi:DMSO reductase anchor subunit